MYLKLISVALAGLALAGRGFAQPPTMLPGGTQTPRIQTDSDEEGGAADGAAPARALQLRVTHTESDNIFDSPDGARGSYDTVGLLLDINRDGRRADVQMFSDLEYRRYSDFLPDERFGGVHLLADIAAVPERFSWYFQDDFGQSRIDPLASFGALNRQSYNVFSTGPQISIPIGSRTYLAATASYSDLRYEDTDSLDSEAKTRQAGLLRSINTTTTVGLVSSLTEIEYDLPIQGFEVESLFVRYDKRFSSGGVRLDLGESELRFGDESLTGPVFQFNWDRRVAARSRLIITADRQFSDTGTLLRRATGQTELPISLDVVVASHPIQSERLNATYVVRANRTMWSFGVAGGNEDYQRDDTLDNRAVNVFASMQRALTAQLRMRLDIDSLRRDFELLDASFRDTVYRFLLARRLKQQISLGLRLESVERKGPDAFDRDSYELLFIYHPGRAGADVLQ